MAVLETGIRDQLVLLAGRVTRLGHVTIEFEDRYVADAAILRKRPANVLSGFGEVAGG